MFYEEKIIDKAMIQKIESLRPLAYREYGGKRLILLKKNFMLIIKDKAISSVLTWNYIPKEIMIIDDRPNN
ncbi:MAG: hypothetical protein OXB84_08615 [Halobacteriovoraceae bacterium]|nr:hypothetical protein [Halobacteriovoraceae bacterium]